MIPKIIHFCWLSNEPYPEFISKCMYSWKEKMPDYQIKKWDTTNFDIESIPFAKEAFDCRKWAFAADVIRLYALYTEGGIYLDSDVFVKKSFDNYLDNGFLSAIEFNKFDYIDSIKSKLIDCKGNKLKDVIQVPGVGIQAAVIAAEKGHPYVKDCLDYYKDRHFINKDGSFDNIVIAPDILAYFAVKYGFKYKDKEQILNNGIRILSSSYIAGHPKCQDNKNIAVHCCTGTWRKISLLQKIIKHIRYKLYIK